MNKLIAYNNLIIAITSLLVGTYVWIFESLWDDKAYLFLLIGLVSAVFAYRHRKLLK